MICFGRKPFRWRKFCGFVFLAAAGLLITHFYFYRKSFHKDSNKHWRRFQNKLLGLRLARSYLDLSGNEDGMLENYKVDKVNANQSDRVFGKYNDLFVAEISLVKGHDTKSFMHDQLNNKNMENIEADSAAGIQSQSFKSVSSVSREDKEANPYKKLAPWQAESIISPAIPLKTKIDPEWRLSKFDITNKPSTGILKKTVLNTASTKFTNDNQGGLGNTKSVFEHKPSQNVLKLKSNKISHKAAGNESRIQKGSETNREFFQDELPRQQIVTEKSVHDRYWEQSYDTSNVEKSKEPTKKRFQDLSSQKKSQNTPPQEKNQDKPKHEQFQDTSTQEQSQDTFRQEQSQDTSRQEQSLDISRQGQSQDTTTQERSQDTPTQEQSKDTPTQEQTQDTSRQEQPQNTPTQEQSQDTPTQEQSKDTPTQEQTKDTPTQEQTQDTSRQKQSQDTPTQEQSQDTSRQKQSQDTPTQGQSQDTSRQKQSQDTPTQEQSQDTSRQKQSQDTPTQEQSQDTSRQKLSQDTPTQKQSQGTSRQKQSQGTPIQEQSQDTSRQKQSQDTPTQEQSQETSTKKLSQDTSRQEKSQDTPTHEKSQDTPRQKKSQDTPRLKKSQDTPRQEKFQYTSRQEKSQDKSKQEQSHEAPEREKTQYKPQSRKSNNNNLNTSATERAAIKNRCQPKHHVMFLKTHKTAGSTVTNILNRYGDKHDLLFAVPGYKLNRFMWPGKFQSKSVNMSLLPSKNRKADILCNHAVYSRRNLEVIMPKDSYYITILRHPMLNFESSFFYLEFPRICKINGTNNHEKMRNFFQHPEMYLKSYLKKKGNEGRLIKNGMVFDLGLPFEKTNDMEFVHEYIKQLEKEFDLVLIAENFDESLIMLKRDLCWDLEDVVYFKFLARKNEPEDLPPDLYKQVIDWNQGDVLLYSYFSRKFNERLKNEGPDFKEEVEQLRQMNEDVKERCLLETYHKKAFKTNVQVEEYKVNANLKDNERKDCCRMVRDEVNYIKYHRVKQSFKLKNRKRLLDHFDKC